MPVRLPIALAPVSQTAAHTTTSPPPPATCALTAAALIPLPPSRLRCLPAIHLNPNHPSPCYHHAFAATVPPRSPTMSSPASEQVAAGPSHLTLCRWLPDAMPLNVTIS